MTLGTTPLPPPARPRLVGRAASSMVGRGPARGVVAPGGSGPTGMSAGGADESSDEALIARLQAGDPAALRLLIERYRGPLYGYLARLLPTAEDAEDLFQETFLRVLRHAERFERGRTFRPWVYAIATNLVRNAHRARSYREAVPLDRPAGEDGERGASLADLLPGRTRLPGEAAERAEAAEAVRRAVRALPDKGREALVLYYFQGLSYEEVAGTLAIPLGTVKSRIHNAMAKLAQALGAHRSPHS